MTSAEGGDDRGEFAVGRLGVTAGPENTGERVRGAQFEAAATLGTCDAEGSSQRLDSGNRSGTLEMVLGERDETQQLGIVEVLSFLPRHVETGPRGTERRLVVADLPQAFGHDGEEARSASAGADRSEHAHSALHFGQTRRVAGAGDLHPAERGRRLALD